MTVLGHGFYSRAPQNPGGDVLILGSQRSFLQHSAGPNRQNLQCHLQFCDRRANLRMLAKLFLQSLQNLVSAGYMGRCLAGISFGIVFSLSFHWMVAPVPFNTMASCPTVFLRVEPSRSLAGAKRAKCPPIVQAAKYGLEPRRERAEFSHSAAVQHESRGASTTLRYNTGK